MTASAPHIRDGRARTKSQSDEIPRDDASEDALLGSLLLDAARCETVFRAVAERDLFSPENRRLYRAIRQVYESRGTTDSTLIRNALAEAGDLERIGRQETPESGVARLLELVNARPTAANAELYAESVAKASARRQLLVRADRLRDLATGPDGRNLEQLRADALAIVDDPSESAGRSRSPFNRITAQQLADGNYELEFIIDGVLVEGQPAGIIGPQKSLKTSLILDAAIAIDRAGYFLGRFPVHSSRRVAVLSAESGLATIQETCQRICRAAGCRLEDTAIVFSDTLPRLGDPAHMRELEKFLTNEGSQVAFFDPFYLMAMTGGDENSIFAMGALLRDIADLCQQCGITPVIAHHAKRGVANPYAPGELADASWAGMSEFLRQWVIVNRRERYEPGTGFHRLWLSVGGSAGHQSQWGCDISEGTRQDGAERFWEVTLMKPDELGLDDADRRDRKAEQRDREKLEVARQKYLRALGKYPAGETLKVLRATAGLDGGTVSQQAFAELLDEGKAIRCDVVRTNRKTPYDGYKLAD